MKTSSTGSQTPLVHGRSIALETLTTTKRMETTITLTLMGTPGSIKTSLMNGSAATRTATPGGTVTTEDKNSGHQTETTGFRRLTRQSTSMLAMETRPLLPQMDSRTSTST